MKRFPLHLSNLPKLVVAILVIAGLGTFFWGAYIPVKAFAAQVLLERSWDKTQASGKLKQPWPWADTGPIARLIFHGTGESVIALSGGHGRALAFGPGHVDGTALPGHPGHSVVSAHRDTHFAVLKEARAGDRITVQPASGDPRTYRVTDVRVMDTRTEEMLTYPDQDLLTLVTCFPFDDWDPGGPLRLIVTAEMV